MNTGNIFSINQSELNSGNEIFEALFRGTSVRTERIVSWGQITPEGQWYDQDQDEWVVLLQGLAKLEFDDNQVVSLKKGDYLFIPAHKRHRVAYTSSDPVCIWLAVHGNIEL